MTLPHERAQYSAILDRPKILAIAIHPQLSGQPSRSTYLETIYEIFVKIQRRAVLDGRGNSRLVFEGEKVGQASACRVSVVARWPYATQ
jgi:hypothetical protein